LSYQLPIVAVSTPGALEAANSATPGGPGNQHQGSGTGGNSPWVAQELPWYQTLDQRVTILAVSVTGLALLMILAALRGLHRLNKKPAPP